jgi:two-component SAPR family response regulator
MSYLFDYKIKKLSNFIMVGFPEKVVDSVKERLKKEKISYVVLDNDYQFVSDKNSYNESNYEILLDISCKSYNVEMEIEKINKALRVLKDTKSIDEIICKIKGII